jgi:capsular polysaccharide transport system permease protein
LKKLLEILTPEVLRLAVIAIPWVATAVYLFFAADRYVSESIVAVRQEGAAISMPSNIDPLAAMFGSTVASREDQYMLRAHILSTDMLQQLDDKLDLRAAYSEPKFDFIFALSRNASQEEFLEYYRSRIDVVVDDTSGLLTIKTQGFSPKTALEVNREVVAISERFINESSHRLARDQMAYADAELKKARAELDVVRKNLLEFQEIHSVLDPNAQAAANEGLTAELRAMLARHGAELKGMQAYLNDDAPQIIALQAQIAGIREQLEYERRGSVTNPDGKSLNVIAGEYQELLAELEFESDSYRGALAGLETARIESTRKLKSLVLVESPALPESATYPRRLYTLLALLMGLALLYGIVRLIVATIEDHVE